MIIKILEKLEEYPLSVDDLKSCLRLDYDDDNDRLKEIIASSVSIIEQILQTNIVKTKYLCYFTAQKANIIVQLPVRFISEIIKVVAIENQDEHDIQYTMISQTELQLVNRQKDNIQITYVVDNDIALPILKIAIINIATKIYDGNGLDMNTYGSIAGLLSSVRRLQMV